MNCPIDGTALMMTERQGVEIDYCPKCRGIWLDRGELDKLIERSQTYEEERFARPAAPAAPPSQPQMPPQPSQPSGYPAYYDDDDDKRYNQPYGKRKKKSFLGDMFDIFD